MFRSSLIALALVTAASPAIAQNNVVVDWMVSNGTPRAAAEAQAALATEAGALEERLSREEPSFAGMYGDDSTGNMVIMVRFIGDAKRTLANYSSNPAFVAVQARAPLAALEKRQQALQRALAARGIETGTSIDFKGGKVRVHTRDLVKTQAAVRALGPDDDVAVVEDEVAPTPAVAVSGGNQTTYQWIETSTLYSDRATLGFNVKSGTASGVLTAAHFGQCPTQSSQKATACTKNGKSFYNPSDATGQLSGTPTLTFQSEQLGGSYDADWRTSSATGDTFANTIKYGNPGAYASLTITSTYAPSNLVVNVTKVCKQGITTFYTCGTFREKYNMLWFGSYGDHYLVQNDAAGAMAASGEGGGPVFVGGSTAGSAWAVGLVSGVFTDPTKPRYNWMSFTDVTTAVTALGVTVKTAP